MFGASKPAGQPAFGGTSIFGQPLQQQNQPATTRPQTTAFGMLSATGPGLFGGSVAQPQVQAQQTAQLPALAQSQAQLSSSLWQPVKELPHQKPIGEQIQRLMEKWDPGNPNCAFKTYFYNKVDEANIPFYRPLPNEDPREWEEALEKKPAPGFIPVKCTSFTGIADRLKTQRRAVADLNTRLHQINGGLDVLLSRHDLQTTVRTAAAHRRNALLHDRCLGLAAKVQVLRNRGYTLSGDEDDLRLKLKALETSIQDPALAAREEELWSRLVVIRGYADRLTEEVKKAKSKDGETLDSDSERGMRKFLEESETQLQHLKREVESIQNDFAAWEKESNGS